MDSIRFDQFVKAIAIPSTRRSALGILSTLGLAGIAAQADDADAKKKKKRKKRKKKKKGCPSGQNSCGATCIPSTDCCTASDCGTCESCLSGACVSGCQSEQACVDGQCICVPEALDVTCTREGCGTPTNNCGDTVQCSCPNDQQCLINGTCARLCPGGSPTTFCPGCGCSPLSTEGLQVCTEPNLACEDVPQGCDTTADCPRGQFCENVGAACGPDPIRCVSVCTV